MDFVNFNNMDEWPLKWNKSIVKIVEFHCAGCFRFVGWNENKNEFTKKSSHTKNHFHYLALVFQVTSLANGKTN